MAYDDAGGQLSQNTSNLFDSAGRTLASVDAAGLVTTYQYPDELTTVTIAPGGLLANTTIRYAREWPRMGALTRFWFFVLGAW